MIDAKWRASVASTPPLDGVLMCPPDHFDVVDEKNVFMRGQAGRVDRSRAAEQWQALHDTYQRLGVRVELLEPVPGREDMVFCANAAYLLPRVGGGADAVLSQMNHPSRQAEVPAVAACLRSLGFDPVELPVDAGRLEGHGDVLVVPGRRLALGGYGGRSDHSALLALEALTGEHVVLLPLIGAVFYHLDTCLAVLDEDTILYHPPAFRPVALATLKRLFPRRIEADPTEALEELAVNVHGLADGHVVMPASAVRTADRLASAGYEPVPVDVSEFHRSGGSVFCMRMDLPAQAS
jgi:N-dimethylarginine dimethylaminohydrolase